jgi:hypothetical protein
VSNLPLNAPAKPSNPTLPLPLVTTPLSPVEGIVKVATEKEPPPNNTSISPPPVMSTGPSERRIHCLLFGIPSGGVGGSTAPPLPPPPPLSPTGRALRSLSLRNTARVLGGWDSSGLSRLPVTVVHGSGQSIGSVRTVGSFGPLAKPLGSLKLIGSPPT